MRKRCERERTAEAKPRPLRDRGTTFIEMLIAIVLVGTIVAATITALTASIRGSDQHRAKIAALADLESAAAYLAREGLAIDCFSSQTDVEDVLILMPGSSNPGVYPVQVDGAPSCTAGLADVSLIAAHQGGRATESLNVVIGGITVLQPGNGSGSGPCTPGVVDVTTPLTASGNKISQPMTVKLFYTGDCSAIPPNSVTAKLTATVTTGPNTKTVPLTDSGAGLFTETFATNALKFKTGPASIEINFNGTPLPTYSFSIG